MAIVEKHKSPATVATPPDGYTTLFIRSDTEVPAIKDADGVVTDLVVPGDASGVTYTPESSLNWTDSVDPGQVDDALDDLALRVVTLESENDPNSFGTIAVSGQSDVVAEQANDTLTLVAGTGISLTTSAGGDSVTITSTGATMAFGTIAVSGQSDVVADTSPDTLTLAAGTGITITTNAGTDTVTFATSVDASQVSYTPQYSINWTDSEDPGQVDDALDDLAARVNFLEANGGAGDASGITYTPADNADWGGSDPGNVDDALDYLAANAGGGSTAGRHAIWIAAGSITPSITGGCAPLATIASAANQPDIQTLNFDTGTQEFAQFSIRMPKSWNEGTVTFSPVWSHAATTVNFGVVWDLQGVAVSDDDPIAVAFGTVQSSTDTGGTTNDIYIGPESSAITIAGTPAAEDMVFFRISRDRANGSDTLAIDARLHGITLFITTDADTDA